MEFILFVAMISLIALSCQLICYAAYQRKSGLAFGPSDTPKVAVNVG